MLTCKKPKKGAPVIGKGVIVVDVNRNELSFKSVKGKSTLKFELINCCKTQKITIRGRL